MDRKLNIQNIGKLITRMEVLRDDQFDMRWVFRTTDGTESRDYWSSIVTDPDQCGTAACIAGECGIVAGREIGSAWTGYEAAIWLGLDTSVAMLLFMPEGYEAGSRRYPLSRAITTLKRLRDRFLATGEVVVDWGPEPGSEPAPTWTAPQAVEIREPALPETLTRLLGAKVEA